MPQTASITVQRLVTSAPIFNPLNPPDSTLRIMAHQVLTKTLFSTVGLISPGTQLRQSLVNAMSSNNQKSPDEAANELADIVEGYMAAMLTVVTGHLDWHFNAHGHIVPGPIPGLAAPPAISFPAPPPFT